MIEQSLLYYVSRAENIGIRLSLQVIHHYIVVQPLTLLGNGKIIGIFQ